MNHEEFRERVISALREAAELHSGGFYREAEPEEIIKAVEKVFDEHGNFCTGCGCKLEGCQC